MNYSAVTDPDGKMRHVVHWQVFMDASGPSACGKRVWPGQWTEADDPSLPLCQACVSAVRNM